MRLDVTRVCLQRANGWMKPVFRCNDDGVVLIVPAQLIQDVHNVHSMLLAVFELPLKDMHLILHRQTDDALEATSIARSSNRLNYCGGFCDSVTHSSSTICNDSVGPWRSVVARSSQLEKKRKAEAQIICLPVRVVRPSIQ